MKTGISLLYTFTKVVELVNRIKELRQQHGMKQSDLARELHIARTAISKYENGQLDFGLNTICALCDIFGCTSDYLLGRSARPEPALTEEEAQLLAAYANATPEIRRNVDFALAPYREEKEADRLA